LGLVGRDEQVKFIDGLVGQLGYVERLSAKDGRSLVQQLAAEVDPDVASEKALRFLSKARK